MLLKGKIAVLQKYTGQRKGNAARKQDKNKPHSKQHKQPKTPVKNKFKQGLYEFKHALYKETE